jgi:hypothetical protein
MISSIKDSFSSINWASVKTNKLLIAWLVFGTAAVLVPPIQWQVQRAQFYGKYGKYVWYEEQQRQYEEAYNQNNDDGNDDGNSASYYYKDCSSWNWKCRAQQEKYAQQYYGDNNNNNNNNNNGYDENGNPVADATIPTWFQLISGSNGQSEAMSRWQEENTGVRQEEDDQDEGKATVGGIIVTLYMALAVLATVIYGANRLYKTGLQKLGRNGVKGLVVALVLVMNLLFLNLMLAPSLVSVEDRMMEESVYGWYGQLGVLMLYIDFYGLLFCAGFLVAFYFIFFRNGKDQDIEQGEEFVTGDYVSA